MRAAAASRRRLRVRPSDARVGVGGPAQTT